MAYGTKKTRRRSRIRAIEGDLILSSLESPKGLICKTQIVGDKLFKKMEAWAEESEEVVSTGSPPPPPRLPSSNSISTKSTPLLLNKNLFRYSSYSSRENIITWDGLTRTQKKEIVSKFLEEGASSSEDRDENFGAWLSDQASWTRKIIRRFRDEGPFFPAGSLLKWPTANNNATSSRPFSLPGLYPVISEENWGKVVSEIREGEFEWDLKALRNPYRGGTSYSSPHSQYWSPYSRPSSKRYIVEDSLFMSLGEWIVMGETKDNFSFIRGAKFLAPVIEDEIVNDFLNKYSFLSVPSLQQGKGEVANKRKKLLKELRAHSKTKPVFILWNAFSGMSNLPGAAGQCGARSPVKGFPLIVKSPAQLPKEGGLKFIFPSDNNGLEEHKLLTRICGLTEDNNSLYLKEDLIEYCKSFLLSLDEEVVKSWRRDSGDLSKSPPKI